MVINDKQPKALRLYGKFLIHIKNDEEEGMAHINLSKKIIDKAAASNIIDMKDLSNDAT